MVWKLISKGPKQLHYARKSFGKIVDSVLINKERKKGWTFNLNDTCVKTPTKKECIRMFKLIKKVRK